MKKINTIYTVFVALFFAGIFISFSSDPPPGRTGAPGESTCMGCHGGQNPGFAGNISITGFPSIIQPNTAYPLTYTITATMGSPARAGFQLVALDDNNDNSGSLTAMGATGLQTSLSKTYIEHRGALSMSSGVTTYNFTWTSPSSAAGNTVTLYTAALMGNGSGSGNDRTLTTSVSGTLMSASPPSVNITGSTNVTCNGANDGTASAQGSGGSAPYTYAWTGGFTGPNVSGLSPGTYVVTVTDDNGMTATDQVTISEPAAILASVGNPPQLSCANLSVGLDASASSGANFSYQWTTSVGNIVSGANSLTPVVDAVGTYELVVTDNLNGCTASTNVTVTENTTLPLVDAGADEELNCNATTVQLQATGSTGSQFTINWSPAANITMGGNSYMPTVNAPGTYTLTVVDNDNGCSSVDMVEVTQIADPEVNVNNLLPVSCNGAMDGDAFASVNFGESPYTYLWSSGETTQMAVNLPGGTNSVTITDNNGCTSSQSFMINSPSVIAVNGVVTPVSGVGANDGSIMISPSGGTPGYTYLWSTNATTQMISGLVPGTYSVVVTDMNNCTATENFTINSFNCSLSATVSTSPAFCFGEDTGEATVVVLGGDSPYTYLWSTGETTATISGLFAGSYTVTVTDDSNCTVSVSGNVAEPTQLIATSNTTDVLCFGGSDGSAEVVATGGTAPYTYSWTNGGNTPNLTGLSAGTYIVSATDANGCQVDLTIVINQPDELSVSLEVIHESGNGANDGAATVMTVTGGTPPYSYLWSNGAAGDNVMNLAPGDYSVVVTDVNGCQLTEPFTIQSFDCAGIIPDVDESNTYICPGTTSGSLTVNGFMGGTAPYLYGWSNGATTATIDNLTAGDYTLSGTDDLGCTFSATYTVVEEDTIAPTLNTQPVTVFLDASGNGTFDVSEINNMSFDDCGGIDTVYVDMSNFTCADLGDNTVQVVVFDENGNCADGPETVTVVDAIAPTIACPSNISTSSCAAINYDLPIVSDNCSMNLVPQLNGLPSGSIFPVGASTVEYSVADDSGNTSTCSFEVVVMNDLAIAVAPGVITCDGTTLLDVDITGGTAPYTSTWFPGGMDNPFVVTDTFAIQVIDAGGCTVSFESSYTPPSILGMVVDSIQIAEQFGFDGAAYISVTGGVAPYTYEWMNSNGDVVSMQEDLIDVTCDRYSVAITDANGCQFTMDLLIDCTSSVFNANLNEFISIYPNPTSGDFRIELDLPSGENVTVRFFDLSGKLIEETEPQFIRNSFLQFENRDWASGIYWVKILVGNEVLVERLMIE